jgi:hypothetical protein
MTQQTNDEGSEGQDWRRSKGDMSDAELLAAIRHQLMRVYKDILHTSPPQHINSLTRRLRDFGSKDE